MTSRSKTSILFVIICSNGKRLGGDIGVYDPAISMREHLEHQSLQKLFERRRSILNILHQGNEVSHGGRLLRGLPYNKELVPGSPDVRLFPTSIEAKYLPAAERYHGRFYQALEPIGPSLLTDTDHHVLIVSGLYGLLTPAEHIQCYSCNVVDHPDFVNRWTKGNFLTNLLVEYIDKHRITKVFDFMADENYRELLSWSAIRNIPKLGVLHALSEQHAGAGLLPSLGRVSQEYLTASEAVLLKVDSGSVERTSDGDVTMQTFLPKSMRSPISPTARDKISRMRRNMIRMLNLLYGTQKPLYQFSERVINLMNRGLLDKKIGEKILAFNTIRNKIEYDDELIADEQMWQSMVNLYTDVSAWAHVQRHIDDRKLEPIDV